MYIFYAMSKSEMCDSVRLNAKERTDGWFSKNDGRGREPASITDWDKLVSRVFPYQSGEKQLH